MSCWEDAIALLKDPVLLKLFVDSCERLRQSKLLMSFQGLCDNIKRTLDTQTYVTRKGGVPVNAKLVFLPDKGGKTRIVYILSWWFQELLFPLHQRMMSWLRSQPQDATYDQRGAAIKIQELTRAGKPVWSFDLTAATDRWPAWHQALAIRGLFGDD